MWLNFPRANTDFSLSKLKNFPHIEALSNIPLEQYGTSLRLADQWSTERTCSTRRRYRLLSTVLQKGRRREGADSRRSSSVDQRAVIARRSVCDLFPWSYFIHVATTRCTRHLDWSKAIMGSPSRRLMYMDDLFWCTYSCLWSWFRRVYEVLKCLSSM